MASYTAAAPIVTGNQTLKILVLVMLMLILGSLALSLIFMVRDGGKGQRQVLALTLRIVLSLLLFGLLFAGYMGGFLQPHGLIPPPPGLPAQSQ